MQRLIRFSLLVGWSLLLALLACSDSGSGDADSDVDTDADTDSDTDTDTDAVVLDGEGFDLRFDLTRGAFDVALDDGTAVLQHAFAEVEVGGAPGGGRNKVHRSTDGFTRAATTADETDDIGTASRAVIAMTGREGSPDLTLTLSVYADEPFFTAAVAATNSSGEAITLARLAPAKIDADNGGALWLGAHPSTHRILEAGSFFLSDFFVDLVPGDVVEPVETLGLGMIHGYQKGHSISNWNHAIKDLDSGRAFVAGALDFEYASPMCNTSFDPEDAETADGRTPFTYWSIEFPYMNDGKPLAAGESLTAGPVLVLPDTDQPHRALERYALATKQHNDIQLWTERDPNNRVITGWNSWTGSSSSGGYGTGIDEQLMLDNMDAMASEFKDFGGEWFQIDDGYEFSYGDWDWNPDRFPSGSKGFADAVKTRGLIPGTWIAIFQISRNSQLYADHEADGWFPDTIPGVGGGSEVLDLTHPDVLDWLRARFRKIRADGFRWIKTDFGYFALGAKNLHDPTTTREEAFRRGLTAIREGLDQGAADVGGKAGDTHWQTVAMFGPHLGHVDCIRPNLDTMPAWDSEGPHQTRATAQGFKPSVRTIARRYYQQNRTLVFNHDLIFFRAHKDPAVTPVTMDESRALITALALSGSVSKIGEKLVEMEPEWINTVRTMLPIFGREARPLDLFEKEFPELWHLHVVPAEGLNTGGGGPAYDVVALFNWGLNDDLTTNPYTPMPDGTERTLSVKFAELGMDDAKEYVAREFWSGDMVAPLTATLTRTVPPHTVELFALREKLDRPQYIGGNRHLFQGAVEIRAMAWNDGTDTLAITYDAAPGSAKAPFTHELDFHLPTGWTLQDAQVPGATAGSVQTAQEGEVLTLSFEVESRQDLQIELVFSE